MINPSVKPISPMVRLGDICSEVSERIANPSESEFERFVGLEHMETQATHITKYGSTESLVSAMKLFKANDILVARRNVYLKRASRVDFDGVCSGDAIVLRSKENGLIVNGLLEFVLNTERFWDYAVKHAAGTMSKRLSVEKLLNYEFALPSIHVQERQVALLRNHDELVGCLQDTAVMADRARRAALLDAFRPDRGSIDTFPSNWEVLQADELGDVQLGQQRHPKYESGSNMRPYLRVANVFDGWIDFSDVNEMHFPEREVKKFELLAGDILLNEGQSFDLVGRSAIYRGGVSGLCCQKTLIRFRCGSRLLPDFAQAYFQHRLYTGQFAAMCVQTTSMAHLTAVRFSAMKMPVPPLDEQKRIANVVAALSEAASGIQRRLRSAKALGARIGGLQ